MTTDINNDLEMRFHKNLPVVSFEFPGEWESWLENNHSVSKGLWVRFYKKGSGIISITYLEALDEALCYGWIDGQLQKYDNVSYLQKFTPRRPKSLWSKRNQGHVTRLESEGKIKPAGRKEVDTAKVDGRWERAYDSPSKMSIPDDFISELSKDKKALIFFETLNRVNKYSIAYRLQTSKNQEIREKRMKEIVEMMAKGKKFHE